MSISASLDFHVQEYRIFDILESLLSTGWTLNDHGNISFSLASDDYSMRSENWNNDKDSLFYIKGKSNISPLQTVCITWKSTNIGCTAVFYHSDTICFQCNINRQTILFSNKEITDYNWYLERLLPTFLTEHNPYLIQKITWEQNGV